MKVLIDAHAPARPARETTQPLIKALVDGGVVEQQTDDLLLGDACRRDLTGGCLLTVGRPSCVPRSCALCDRGASAAGRIDTPSAERSAGCRIRDGGGDPTPAAPATSGTIVVVVATGGAAVAASGSEWIAPITALVGAVFVAILTAVTTNRRLVHQLDAEDRRITRQLAHTRDLGELQHLREFFDDLAAAFETRLDAQGEWASALREPRAEDEALKSTAFATLDAYRRMNIASRRLGLRPPFGHPVCEAYRAAEDMLDVRGSALDVMFVEGFDQHSDRDNSDRVMILWGRFVDAARAELDRRAAAAE